MFLSVNFRSVGQPVVRPRPSFRPVHPRMDFQKGGKQENLPHSRSLSCTRVYIIMYVNLTSAGRAAAYFPTCGKGRRSVPRETFPHVGKRTATCVWATSNLEYISHNVFLGTLSRVIKHRAARYVTRVFHFALCSLILQHHFVAEASQRAERATLASPMLLSLESAKAKNFVFPFALCSLIHNFAGQKSF